MSHNYQNKLGYLIYSTPMPCDLKASARVYIRLLSDQWPCLSMVGGYITWGQLFFAKRLCLAPDTKPRPPKLVWSKSGEILALDPLASKFPMFESSGLCHMGYFGGKGLSYQLSKFGGLEGNDQLGMGQFVSRLY